MRPHKLKIELPAREAELLRDLAESYVGLSPTDTVRLLIRSSCGAKRSTLVFLRELGIDIPPPPELI